MPSWLVPTCYSLGVISKKGQKLPHNQHTDQSLNSGYQETSSSITKVYPAKAMRFHNFSNILETLKAVLCTGQTVKGMCQLPFATCCDYSLFFRCPPTSNLWHTWGPEAITTKSTLRCANVSGMSNIQDGTNELPMGSSPLPPWASTDLHSICGIMKMTRAQAAGFALSEPQVPRM